MQPKQMPTGQPIRKFRVGEPLTKRRLDPLVERINMANAPVVDQSVSYARWAITCKDESGTYPLPTDNPGAYPFRWFDILPRNPADSNSRLPLKQLGTPFYDFERFEPTDNAFPSKSPVDGFAVNINEYRFTRAASSPPSYVIDYVREGTIAPVSFHNGSYYIHRPDIDSFAYVTTELIQRANIQSPVTGSIFYSGLCDVLFFYVSPVDGTALLSSMLLPDDTPLQQQLYNPTGNEDIPAGTLVWGMRYAGGVQFANIWGC